MSPFVDHGDSPLLNDFSHPNEEKKLIPHQTAVNKRTFYSGIELFTTAVSCGMSFLTSEGEKSHSYPSLFSPE